MNKYLRILLNYRYLKTKEQEDVDYLADGKNIGHEMRYKTETMEIDKRGEDETDLFVSSSAKGKKKTNNRQPHRYRGNITFLKIIMQNSLKFNKKYLQAE